MRALPIVSVLVLSLSALAACSSDSEGRPPSGGAGSAPIGGAGAPPAGGGAPGVSGATGVAGAPVAGAGAPSGGGATGTAGGTGTAGAPTTGGGCTMTKAGLGTDGLIDDFETHPMSALIPATDGRLGGWWISVSATGSVTTPTLAMPTGGAPLPVDGGMTGKGLHLVGKDTDLMMGWGADASVALAGTGNCYDASAYTGGIKIALKGKPGSVYVQVITAQNKAASATSGNQRKEIPITDAWVEHTIPWADLVTGWGTPIPLDPKSIVALDIAPSAASASDFDIWIDNLSFYK